MTRRGVGADRGAHRTRSARRRQRNRTIPSEPIAWIRDRDGALELVAAATTRVPVGVDVVVLLDPDGGWIEAFPMEPGSSLPEVVELCASRLVPGAALLIVSNRTGEVPADRSGDELAWEELRGIATSHGIHLLDWFVFSGRWTFSAAEFAPSGDGWSSYRPRHHSNGEVG